MTASPARWVHGGPHTLRAMRARALAPRVGYLPLALAGTAALGLGVLIGRWWKKRQLAKSTTMLGDESGMSCLGVDA